MYTVTVRDHIMIAHSLHGEIFGPSQRMHGATYVVDLALRGSSLDENGILVDISAASSALRGVLDELDRRNLDEVPAFAARNSTTEAVARHIADGVAAAVAGGALGEPGRQLAGLCVTVHESPSAWASFDRELTP